MKLPFVTRKRFEIVEHELHEYYREQLAGLEEFWEGQVAAEYEKAKVDIAAQLRELLVDANYEIFNSSDQLLRPKLYAFMSTALAQFHEKAQRSKNA